MKLGYLAARFPFAHAEQFFEPEVRSLSATFDVTLFETRARSRTNRYPDLPVATSYLGILGGAVLAGAAREIARDPKAVVAAFAAVAFGRCALRARAVNLVLFPKALAFAGDLRRRRIEHVHVNWMTSSATLAFVASRLTGIPFSITAHQHDIFYDNLTVSKVRAASFVRVISERNCGHLRELVPPELRTKCRVVFLGVDLPAEVAARAAGRRILCPARMCEWKGHRYLLAALAALRDRGVAFTCDLAGDGEIEDHVRALVAEHGLGDRVRLRGIVPHGALVRELRDGAYDLVVLASTERDGEHEGIPVALMEAMAAELPVVATRTGSIPELVDAASGILVEQRDPTALAAAIETVLADPARARSLGRHGRARVERDFATQATTRRLADLLLAGAPWWRGRAP